MDDIVIIDNEYITLVYHAQSKIIHHTIHQPITGQPLRDAVNKGTETLAKYGACKWLSDDRKNGPLSKEDAEWGFNDWNPRTIKAGWKYWANVIPYELYAAGSLNPMMENLRTQGLEMRVFIDVDKAMEWLLSVGDQAE